MVSPPAADGRGEKPKAKVKGGEACRPELTGAEATKGAGAAQSNSRGGVTVTVTPAADVAKKADKEAGGRADVANGLDGKVQTSVLETLRLSPAVSSAAKEAWRRFADSFPSREAAAEELYLAIFRTAPDLQKHFVTPKAIQSVRFFSGIEQLVCLCCNETELLKFVENLGFMHLQLEVVTPPRVVAFRDSVVSLMADTLGEAFASQEREGMTRLLDYAGGANIYVRTAHAQRLRIIEESWRIAQDSKNVPTSMMQRGETGFSSSSGGSFEKFEAQRQLVSEKGNPIAEEKVSGLGRLKRFLRREATAVKEAASDAMHSGSSSPGRGNGSADASSNKQAGGENLTAKGMPNGQDTSFAEMFEINAAVMGCGKATMVWMRDVMDSFDAIVVNIADLNRLKEEIQVVALRLSKHPEAGHANLNQFRSCMLAALRSLLPKHWTTSHEEAWIWMWGNVATMLQRSLECVTVHEKSLQIQYDDWDEAARYDFRKDIYSRFFVLAPAGQDFFKQSNTRLHFIADRIIYMTAEIFKKPRALVTEISALGLRHVGFGIPPKLFPPFLNACVEVMQTKTQDECVLEAFRWSLWLISQILVRTIGEGSTVVMQAINHNSISQLKKAISKEPRGHRFQALLDVHVGEQHISPLLWAIESGSLKVAEAILNDLLTIRADRDRYYFGVDELFGRHPDIVKRICEEAPTLLMTLLDGLVWRSHRTVDTTEGTMRRCNLFLKHILIKPDNSFSDSLKWISSTGDPAFVSHPVISKMMEMLWGGVVYQGFILSRTWNMVSLLVFVFSQELLVQHFEQTVIVRYLILSGRVFTYVIGMGKLLSYHLGRIWGWCRDTMNRIIQEIDTDGNGSIDREEMIEALSRFTSVVSAEIKKALSVLRDDDGIGAQEEARKAIANKEKNLYNRISFSLLIVLALMLSHEPIIWCSGHEDWPVATCDGIDDVRKRYSILAMLAMAVHWFILIDLAVFNTQISAFLLVVGHVVAEVKQFLMALAFLLLMFGSAISIMCRNCPTEGGDYSDMPNAIVTLFAITVSLYQGDFRQIQEDPALLIAVFLFLTASVILLLNLLIAQLNRSYEYIYQDMLGFARLNRASLIVDAMNREQKKAHWQRYVASLRFDERVEFDEGDLGLAGCIQTLEDAKLNRQLVESIRRYGGTTSPLEPWPEDKSEASHQNTEERLDSIEAMIRKALGKFEARRKRHEDTGAVSEGEGSGGSHASADGASDAGSRGSGRSVSLNED